VSKTIQQYDLAAAKCEAVFVKKTKDYGTAWRILRTSSLTDQLFIKANLRTSSLTDQLFIKAKRVRSLETNAEQKIDEGVESEYIGLINYSAMALIQIEMDDTEDMELPAEEATKLYQEQIQVTKKLML